MTSCPAGTDGAEGYVWRFVAAWVLVAGLAGGLAAAAGAVLDALSTHPAVHVISIALRTAGACAAVCLVLVLLSGLTRKRLLPARIGVIRVVSCGAFRPSRLVGRLIGCTEERMRSSFLALQNALVLSWWDGQKPSRLLVLLPHCLEREVRARIEHLLVGYECSWEVVNGGTEALAAVKAKAPDGLLAVACERDLLHGVMSIGTRVPWVVVLPNIQGEKPCRSTRLDLNRLVQAMDRLAVRSQATA